MTTKNNHYIDGKWMLGEGNPFSSRDPASEEIIWQGRIATAVEINIAIEAALNAKADWSKKSVNERIVPLKQFAKIVQENAEKLVLAISKETGKPLWEAKNEVNSVINKVDISIDAYTQRCPTLEKELPNGLSVTRHKPHGIVAVFGPFNFPAHLPNGHIIPALLAGNTVIFKPSEMTPLVGETMMEFWQQTELPPGVLNMVQGGRDAGRILAGHRLINGLFFTGSWETGLILSEQFAKHPERILALEMGGNNPLIISKNLSDPKAAAFMVIQSAFLTSGQRCSCARRLIIVKSDQSDALIQNLVRLTQSIKVGHYTDQPEPFMGPVISEFSARHLLAVQETLKAKGGRPLVEMRLLKIDTALLSPGIIDVSHVASRPDEEVFGPFLQLIQVPSFDAAIEEANNTLYGLTAGLISTDKAEYDVFFNRSKAGVINWNTPLTGASSAAPFGGIGKSGNHRPSAYYAADYCAYPVASLETNEIKLPDALPPGIELQ